MIYQSMIFFSYVMEMSFPRDHLRIIDYLWLTKIWFFFLYVWEIGFQWSVV